MRAAILDWAGTTVDYGSLAPVRVLESLFQNRGVPITAQEARLDMGLLKKDQIRSILAIPRVKSAWLDQFGTAPAETDVEALFADFIPQQLDCLADYSELIPGVTVAVEMMRRRGMRIGTTTGYTRPMLDLLLEKAASQGYAPESSVCPDDAGGGRPLPWMCYLNAIRLQVFPLGACVKIGDTLSDVEEGLNAGMWTVGVAATGNLVGMSEAEFSALRPSDRDAVLQASRNKLVDAGAHYIIDSVSNVEPALDMIDERLARGERP